MKKPILFDLISISFKADKKLSFFKIFYHVLNGVLPLLEFFTLKRLIDSLIENSNRDIKTIFFNVALLILIMLISRFLTQYMTLANKSLAYKIENFVRKDVADKFSKVSYKYIDDSETYDVVSKISGEDIGFFSSGFSSILNLFSILLQLISAVYVMVSYLGAKTLIIIVLIILTTILAILNGMDLYKESKARGKDYRHIRYLLKVLTHREFANERSFFRYSEELGKRFQNMEFDYRLTLFKNSFLSFLKMNLLGVLIVVFTGYVVYQMMLSAVGGLITIGTIISFIKLMMDIAISMRWTVMNSVFFLAYSYAQLKDFRNLDSLELVPNSNELRNFEEKDVKSIEVENLSFKYPKGDKNSLENVSLNFKKGNTYAIVGRNGSGKTTLVKILSGLYDEYQGTVKIDGVNIKDLNLDDIRNTYSIMYQDFAKYPVSLKENITCGNETEEFNKVKYEEVLNQVGLTSFIETLDKKDETLLGKIAEGATDISGGQWQKTALGRNLYNPSPVRIYDEPTAAMDPISESDFFEKLHSVHHDRINIYITHRLASTKMVDEIIVLDEGRVVEVGNHKELMDKKGIYYNLYNDQRRWYENGERDSEAI